MAMVRKKQDDKYLEALRELITTGGGNRQCFDCGQKGPTYVNMTIGSFVCTRCSGVLRGITPPHRVKSISMATFTQDEIDFLKAHGNDVCAKTWLGLWDPKRAVHQDQRELMIDKYERKRYYLEPASPLKSLTNATNLKTTAAATTASTSSSSTSANNNQINNNNRSSTNNNNNNNNTQIQLTPPTSQRTTANGLHKTSSSAISRPQHSTVQAQNGFASSHNTDAFGLHNGLNSSVGSMSTGALSDTSSCASANGFGAEADFVADFGSADIFNATVASSPASSVASSTTTNNGYAKIQPIKTAQQQFMNGHSVSNNTNLQNGNLSNGNTENFADFDHAPIYNAAGVIEEPPNYQFVRKNAIRKKSNASVSSSIIRRNERQLKDILEMDSNENVGDYINFEEDDVFGESKSTKTAASCNSKTPGYSNLFDDFDTLLTFDDGIRQQQQQQQQQRHVNSKGYESDYVNIGGDNSANTTKFTPLALAAHATAMAVLGNQSHFNQQQQQLHVFENTTTKPLMLTANQWDVWSESKSTSSPNTAWFSYEQTQQQQQQQHQLQQQLQNPYANINAGNLLTQQPQYQQHFASNSTFALSSATHPSSATIFDTGKTTLLTTSAASSSSALTIGTTMTTTSMLNQNSTINTTTNPFRMHLDVNDNDNNNNHHNRNIINYNYNNNRNYFQITTTTSTPTPTTTTTINSFDYNQNFNNSNSNFDFVANSILSYNFEQQYPKTATTTTAASLSSVNSLTTMSTSLPPIHNYAIIDNNNNNCDNNYSNMSLENSNSNSNFNSNSNSKNSTTNPFLTTLDNLKFPSSTLNDPYTITKPTTTRAITTSSPFTTSSVNTIASSSLDFCSNKSPENPFNSTSLQIQSPIASQQDHLHYHHYPSFHQNVVDINANNIQMSSNNNMLNSVVDQNQVVAPHTDIDKNSNLNSNSNTYQNDNQNPNQNLNNKSWRLPINNNNNNKNSTTNGFNNNINNNNNNNLNHNSSAPAEDRYAALKDLDEQLRESKAVAAQAASIVTANVVDSGFGNPNVNGTVNPFATHQHHHQQTAVVNPFQQNASNNPTQNTTQQLFGQMTLIPNGIATANGFLNAQKTHTANTGFFNYTASGFTNANTPAQLQQQQQQQQQQHQIQATVMYPTSIQTGPNGCGFGFGTLQQQIASTGTGLTTNTFNNPFAATGALNSNNPFL